MSNTMKCKSVVCFWWVNYGTETLKRKEKRKHKKSSDNSPLCFRAKQNKAHDRQSQLFC